MTMDPQSELIMVRLFDAPLDVVWRACRTSEALKAWWGQPTDAVMPLCTVDFRVGGTLHYGTCRPGRPLIWFLCRYLEIVEGRRLVLTQHRSDETGQALDSPLWPASTITLDFEEVSGRTGLTVHHAGMVSERASADDYRQGWTETLDRLAGHLATPG